MELYQIYVLKDPPKEYFPSKYVVTHISPTHVSLGYEDCIDNPMCGKTGSVYLHKDFERIFTFTGNYYKKRYE